MPIRRTVVLVPGVGLFGLEMAALSWRLRRMGYRAETFWMNPWTGTLADKAKDLREFLASGAIEAPLFVAHSFGGRILLQLINDYPELAPIHAVTLGSPLIGSCAARRVIRIPGGRWIVGRAMASVALEGTPPIPADCKVASIAGTVNLVLGLLLCPNKANDTIICVDETLHPDVSAHLVLPVTHTSMLASRRVANCVDRFFTTGTFADP